MAPCVMATPPITLAWYDMAFIAYLNTLVWAEFNQGLSYKIIWGGAIIFRALIVGIVINVKIIPLSYCKIQHHTL